MAVINGAKSVDDVIRTVKSGFMSVMRLTWITSPLAMVIAQKYIPQEVRPPNSPWVFDLMENTPTETILFFSALGALLQSHKLCSWCKPALSTSFHGEGL